MKKQGRVFFLLATILILAISFLLFYNEKRDNAIRHNISIPHQLLNKRFLQSFDWKNRAVLENMTQKWKIYNGPQDYQGLTVLKEQKIQLLDIPSDIQLRQYNSDQILEIVIVPMDFPENFKDSYFNLLVKIWGKPYKVVDKTYFRDKEKLHGIVDVKADWFFKNTIIRFICCGGKTYGKWIPIVCALRFTKKNKLEPLHDLIYLKLQGQAKSINLGVTEEITLVFVVDFNNKELLRTDLSSIADIKYVSKEIIKAEWDDEETTNLLLINRYIGTFSWDIRSKTDKNMVINIEGECKKIESYKAKF